MDLIRGQSYWSKIVLMFIRNWGTEVRRADGSGEFEEAHLQSGYISKFTALLELAPESV